MRGSAKIWFFHPHELTWENIISKNLVFKAVDYKGIFKRYLKSYIIEDFL